MEEVKEKNLGFLLQGFKGGGEPDPPEEAPNTLFSDETARILDLISEGEIDGLVDGMKSIYVDDTPLQNSDGSFNFQDVAIVTRVGTQDQSPMPTFSSAENEIALGVELKKENPVVRNFTNPDLTALRVRISTPVLSYTDTESGDTNGSEVEFNIELSTDNGPYQLVHKGGFYGKTNAKYSQSIRVALPRGATQWTIRVVRLTSDASTLNVRNQTFVDAITEIVDANLRYPNSALVGVAVLSKQFQSVPKRGYLVRGIKVKIPTNYDPYARTYTGNWDGSFKLSWTNNPAWIFYALATNPRWGLGDRIKEIHMDKWNLYQIGQHCDQLVPDGKGGMEPRFTINTYLQSRDQAYELLQNIASVFRGMAYYAAGIITASSDRPALESPFIFSKSNVVGGKFHYQGSPRDTRYSVAVVGWNDPEDMYRLKHEVVEDKSALARYGYKPTEFLAFGCTSRGQAQRAGRWALLTSQLETQVCTWTVGLEALKVVPGSICAVQDADKSNIPDISGRISAVTANTVTLDRLPSNKVQVGHKLYVTTQTGVTQVRTISSISGKKLTVSQAFTTLPQVEGQWAIETDTQMQLFRVLSVKDKGGMQFEIKATQHDPRKYDAIESATLIEKRPVMDWGSHGSRPRTPTELDINAKTVKISGQVSGTVGVITWSSDVARHRVSYQRDNDGWVIKDVVGTSLEIVNFKFGTYRVSVEAINTLNLKSEPAELEKVVDSVEFSLPAPTNLRVDGEFTSSVLKTIWDSVEGATGYTVRVYTSGVLRREVNVGNTLRFDYNYSDMKHDGGPWRTINIQVMATGPFNTKSPWASLTATNPQIGPLQGIEVLGNVKAIVFNCIKPGDDDLAGILVWVSDRADFIPTSENYVYDGLFNQVFIQELNGLPLEHKDYYVWAAGYDNFGKDSLNISSSAVGRPMVLELDPESITADMIQDGILDIAKFASSIRPIQIVDELPETGTEGDQVFLTTDGKNYRWHEGQWDSSVATSDLTGKITSPQLDENLQHAIALIDGDGVGSVNARLDDLSNELKQDTDTKVAGAKAEATAEVNAAKAELQGELATARADLEADATAKTEAAKTTLRAELASTKSELEQDLADAKAELQGDATAKVTAAKSELRTDIDNAKTELSQDLAAAKSELESDLLAEATERKNQILDEMSLRVAGDDAQAAALVITSQNQEEALAITREAVVARIRDAEASIVEEREVRATQDEAIARQLVVLEATVNEDVSAAIANEALVRETADEALTQQLNTLTSTVGSNTSAIENEATTRADADAALASRATTLENKVNDAVTGLDAAHTRITSEETARTTADSALATRATNLETKVNHSTTGLEAAHTRITAEETARSTADSALATRATNLEASVSDLEGELDDTNARLTTEEIARADADSALAGRATALETKVNHSTTGLAAAHSRITAEESTRASADTALATRATNLESSVAGLEGEIDGVSARLTTEEGTRAAADSALATRATNLEASVTNINSDISDVNARIDTEETARADADTALGNRTSTLETKVNHSTTGLEAAHTRITAEETARTTADAALAGRATALETKVNHATTGLEAAHSRITTEESARADADTALGNRTTTLEGKVNHATTGLAAAHTRITDEETIRANADSALATRATNLETSVSNIEGDISDTNARIAAEETARAAADTALATRATNLETKVNHATTGLAAAHARVTAEESARTSADSALATRATNLEASVGNLDAAIQTETAARISEDEAVAQKAETLRVAGDDAAAASMVMAIRNQDEALTITTEAMKARFRDNEASIEEERVVRATEDEALASRITELKATVDGEVSAAIQEEALVRANADSALAGRTTALETSVNHAETGLAAAHTRISNEETARADADTALGNRTTSLESKVNHASTGLAATYAKVAAEETTRANADTALGNRATALETKVNHATTGLAATYAKVAAEETTRADADTALGNRATALETKVNHSTTGLAAAHSRIAAEETTRANADTALATRATNLETKVNHATTGLAATYAKVTAEETARANADSALASRTSTLETTVDGHTASISTQATSIDGLSAQYVVKVTTGGYISGYGLASTAVNGIPTSAFKITADAFVIGQPGVTDVNPFSVEVNGSNSRMVLDGSIIATGSITAGALAANSVTAGTVAAGAISADQIAANAISVKHLAIGDLSNIMTNGDQRFGIEGWEGNVELVPTLSASPTGKAIKLKGKNHSYGEWFSVKAGDVYYFSMKGASAGTKPSSATGNLMFGLEVKDKAGTVAYITACTLNFGTNSWGTSLTGLASVSGNYVEARIWVGIDQPEATATVTAQLSSLEVRRGSNGTMIQEGSITTQHITATGISGDVIQANTLNGDRIIGNTIHGDRITAGTLTADKIGAGTYEVGKNGYGLIKTKDKTWRGDNNGFFFESQQNGKTGMEMTAGDNNYFWLDYDPVGNQASGAIELNGAFYADSTGYMRIDAVDVAGTLQLRGNSVTAKEVYYHDMWDIDPGQSGVKYSMDIPGDGWCMVAMRAGGGKVSGINYAEPSLTFLIGDAVIGEYDGEDFDSIGSYPWFDPPVYQIVPGSYMPPSVYMINLDNGRNFTFHLDAFTFGGGQTVRVFWELIVFKTFR